MNKKPVSISKKPELTTAQDFYRLRSEGIGFVEQMGNRQWTDYNTHDPGITVLEALCYAITDLAYRTGKDIKDILAPAIPSTDKNQPYPDQSFFTARKILTVNPWTPDDFRRILTDLDAVRNAWVFCKECSCETEYYAWCEEDQLRLSYQKPVKPNLEVTSVSPRGLYEVMLELESDPETGDLNDRKIEYPYTVHDTEGESHQVILELRFPEWELGNNRQLRLFLDSDNAFGHKNGESFKLKPKKLGATKAYNVLTDDDLNEAGKDNYLRRQWKNILYADFEIKFLPGSKKVYIENVAIKILGDTASRNQSTVKSLSNILSDQGFSGIIQLYRRKLKKVEAQLILASSVLNKHRNLDEDFCRVRCVGIEDVGVCADIEVANDADIDKVQAQVRFEIENYFNPPVPFYSLREMMDEGIAVEDIFNGPELDNGFIKNDDLAKSELKKVLRTSDIVNILMEIEGIVAVNNMLLGKYDNEGYIVKGGADPKWVDGVADFDPEKTSASWLLFMSPQHLPRLYQNASRFNFYKNGLPFSPRMDEVKDTLTQLRGEAERPKFRNETNDLPVPPGTFNDIEDYYPVQYSLPLTYGTGPEGLPLHASDERKAKAKQLKAYLMVFEQLLGNSFAQLSHASQLFSLNPEVDKTYFVKEFTEELVRGYDDIKNGLDTNTLEDISETLSEFRERRNRFLNHLLARFGEQFSEYALLLTNLQGKGVASQNLIEDKISFLKTYPSISQNRAKAFNYRADTGNPENIPGLKKRISLLLGFPDLSFEWVLVSEVAGIFNLAFRLKGTEGHKFLKGKLEVTATNLSEAKEIAFSIIGKQMIQPEAYQINKVSGKFILSLSDKNGNTLAECPDQFASAAEAGLMIEKLSSWCSNERSLVVEHLLLRPKFPGDALYPACSDGSCATCGDEDPYSFRLTYVMPGWTAPFNTNLDMRRFADRTIRTEIPSHLLGKICWVGNDGFIENACDPLISELSGILVRKGTTSEGVRPTAIEACGCAMAVYSTFSAVFAEWYSGKTLVFIHADALKKALGKIFSLIKPEHFTCSVIFDSAIWKELVSKLTLYFHDIALYGWQFERFEDAWYAWLKENSSIDWTSERLHECVEAILRENLKPGKIAEEENICACAKNILIKYGTAFHGWMASNFTQGLQLADFPKFVAPQIALCSELSFRTGTAALLSEFLFEKYTRFTRSSYHLWIVVNLLGNLRNTYPGATLHDCDDGSDQNPVRLGSTALGNYALQRNPEN